MSGQSNSGDIPKSDPSYPVVEKVEENFEPQYRNEVKDEVVETILRKVNILFRIWKKFGSQSAVRFVLNSKNEYVLNGLLRLLDDNRELWTFDMFHTLLPEIYILNKHYDEEYVELVANTIVFLISAFKPVIINNLIPTESSSDMGRLRRQRQCKATYERLIDIKQHLLGRRREFIITAIYPLYEELIALIQDLEDSPHR